MTRRNKPSVTIVIGMVRIMRMGFTITFAMTSTNATIRAEGTKVGCKIRQ